MKYVVIMLIALVLVGLPNVIYAQDIPALPPQVTYSPVPVGVPVQDSITDVALYDWWTIDLSSNQVILITMTASNGLRPLVGVLNPVRELVARSEPSEINGVAQLRFEAPSAGSYTIVPTRVENEQGITTGDYTLEVSILSDATPIEVDPFREVVIACDGMDIKNALTLRIEDDYPQTNNFRLSVYGLDGFVPVLRTIVKPRVEPFIDRFCTDSAEYGGAGFGYGDTLMLPDGYTTQIEGESVRMIYENSAVVGVVQINVGMQETLTGRFVVVIDGLQLGEAQDRDLIEIGAGALLNENDRVYAYAVANPTTRLDTFLQEMDLSGNVLFTCDDAGTGDCEAIPTIDGFNLSIVEDGTTLQGGTSDGGIALHLEDVGAQLLFVESFRGRTHGQYSLIVIGEVVPD
ncbi:MAG: hypothetical protein ACOYLB_04775 [Phototrophicaceae bacterium]